MHEAKSLEKTLELEKIEGRRRRGQQRMGWMDGITESMDMNLGPTATTKGAILHSSCEGKLGIALE